MKALLLLLAFVAPAWGQWQPLTPYEFTGDTTKGVVYDPNGIFRNDSDHTYITCTDEWQGGFRYERTDDAIVDSFGVYLRADDSIWLRVMQRLRDVSQYSVTWVRGPFQNWKQYNFPMRTTADHFWVDMPSMNPGDTTQNIDGVPCYIGMASVHRPQASVASDSVMAAGTAEYLDILGNKVPAPREGFVRALGYNRFLIVR